MSFNIHVYTFPKDAPKIKEFNDQMRDISHYSYTIDSDMPQVLRETYLRLKELLFPYDTEVACIPIPSTNTASRNEYLCAIYSDYEYDKLHEIVRACITLAQSIYNKANSF